MKNHKLFMPNRQVFFEGKPEGKETAPKAPDLFAKELEATAEGKPPTINVDKKLPKEREEVKTDSKEYQDALPVLMNKLKNSIKNQARDPRHNDMIGDTINGRVWWLIIDETVTPKERIFKKTEKSEEGTTKKEHTVKQAGDTSPERVKEKTKGYPEIKPGPADVIKYAKSIFKAPKGGEIKNGDIVAVYQDKHEFIILHDLSSTAKFRVFRSPQEVAPPT